MDDENKAFHSFNLPAYCYIPTKTLWLHQLAQSACHL
jgi:hypothetical protein